MYYTLYCAGGCVGAYVCLWDTCTLQPPHLHFRTQYLRNPSASSEEERTTNTDFKLSTIRNKVIETLFFSAMGDERQCGIRAGNDDYDSDGSDVRSTNFEVTWTNMNTANVYFNCTDSANVNVNK